MLVLHTYLPTHPQTYYNIPTYLPTHTLNYLLQPTHLPTYLLIITYLLT
jgi:hypothetical protein